MVLHTSDNNVKNFREKGTVNVFKLLALEDFLSFKSNFYVHGKGAHNQMKTVIRAK
jgi:hypothetical protein